MSRVMLLLAQGTGLTKPAPESEPFSLNGPWRDTALLAGGGLLVILLLSAVFYVVRRSRSRDDTDDRVGQIIESAAEKTEPQGRSRGRHRHRRRRHRHHEEQRNPSLKETGGLPPQRPADQPPVF